MTTMARAQILDLISRLTVILIVLLMVVACGSGTNKRRAEKVLQDPQLSQDPLPPFPLNPLPGSTPPSSVGNGSGGGSLRQNPPLEFRVDGVGYTEDSVEVLVRDRLKVVFAPGQQDTPIEGSGAYPNYGQLGGQLVVNSMERWTPLLSNGVSRSATQSPVYDFSNAIPDDCDNDPDPGCRVSVYVIFRKPNYDYWFLNFGIGPLHTHVHFNHPWNGIVFIETDDTDPIEE